LCGKVIPACELTSIVALASRRLTKGFQAHAPLGTRLIPKEGFMLTLRELVKDRKVYSIDAASTVLEAARFMMEHNIGALPVLRNGELAGIFSERDIMNRVVAVGRTPGHTAVSEVMTANPRAVNVDESVEECLFIMHEFGFRHLPIVEGKQLRGLVSLRDIVKRQAEELDRKNRLAS
jgi:CBS domain-containing protein